MTHLLSKKLASVTSTGGIRLMFWCPGCEERHVVSVGEGEGPRWGYNGDPEAPTLTPSILIRSGHHASGWKEGDDCWCTWREKNSNTLGFSCSVCHSFVTNGRILFLQDCTHALAGQTVDLPDYPYKEQTA